MKHEATPAMQYNIGPGLVSLPPIHVGESISKIAVPFPYFASALN
jgi:hypothetical protein